MLKAVLFDMDGVIVNTEPLHRKAFFQTFNDINIDISDDVFASFTGRTTMAICKALVEEFKLPMAPQTMVDIKRHHFKYLFENDSELDLLDGVFDLIKEYHSNGLSLVLASSSSMDNINNIFDRFNLNPYFVGKMSGTELKASKPHPEIFENAALASGHQRHECMVIEDSTNGIIAAKNAGIFCVGYDSVFSKDQDYTLADLVINDFREISYPIISEHFKSVVMSR